MGRSGLSALGILLATLLLGMVASILLPVWQHPSLAVVPADDQGIDWSAGLGEHGAVYILREMSRGRALSDERGQLVYVDDAGNRVAFLPTLLDRLRLTEAEVRVQLGRRLGATSELLRSLGGAAPHAQPEAVVAQAGRRAAETADALATPPASNASPADLAALVAALPDKVAEILRAIGTARDAPGQLLP